MGEKEFDLLKWSSGIPLCDDVWLGMQARNIAIVDLDVVRVIESNVLEEYFKEDQTPTGMMLLSGMSQMWIFSVYEFLRTWRAKAKHIIKTADEYVTVKPSKQEKFLNNVIEVSKGRHKFVKSAPSFYTHQLKQIPDPKFVDGIWDYMKKTEELFEEVSHVRMSLAKHEVKDKAGFAAEAPGYGRMSLDTGAIYWQVALADETVTIVNRRRVANAFLEIKDDGGDGEGEHDPLAAPRGE
ncbi:hypothetical protein [Bradyrhizobium embrapense]|uniref:hypothetical protein n=1 Tax=Bradyrhizobium embrapense TaxID=630921 RepID=UPI00067AA382|nr:hypothetical protein [Bradyrhizobium embrapense]